MNLECASSSSLSQTNINRGTETVPSLSILNDDDRIKVALMEAENFKRETRFEAFKREEAEKSAIDAIKRVYKFLFTCVFCLEVSKKI